MIFCNRFQFFSKNVKEITVFNLKTLYLKQQLPNAIVRISDFG